MPIIVRIGEVGVVEDSEVMRLMALSGHCDHNAVRRSHGNAHCGEAEVIGYLLGYMLYVNASYRARVMR